MVTNSDVQEQSLEDIDETGVDGAGLLGDWSAGSGIRGGWEIEKRVQLLKMVQPLE